MTLTSSLALFMAMLVLAVLPGPGVLLIVAKSLGGGMRNAIATTVGIVLGDYVYIVLAVLGLSAAMQALGPLFSIVKYLGAAYLFWLGLSLLRTKPQTQNIAAQTSRSYWGDLTAGLLTTLANPKAMVFYISFFPAFLDLEKINLVDIAIVLVIVTACLVPVMLSYAWITIKSQSALNRKGANQAITKLSSVFMFGSAAWLALKN